MDLSTPKSMLQKSVTQARKFLPTVRLRFLPVYFTVVVVAIAVVVVVIVTALSILRPSSILPKMP